MTNGTRSTVEERKSKAVRELVTCELRRYAAAREYMASSNNSISSSKISKRIQDARNADSALLSKNSEIPMSSTSDKSTYPNKSGKMRTNSKKACKHKSKDPNVKSNNENEVPFQADITIAAPRDTKSQCGLVCYLCGQLCSPNIAEFHLQKCYARLLANSHIQLPPLLQQLIEAGVPPLLLPDQNASITEIQHYNELAKAKADQLSTHCPCGRRFHAVAYSRHLRMCRYAQNSISSLNATNNNTVGEAPLRKSLICHLCGREIHMKAIRQHLQRCTNINGTSSEAPKYGIPNEDSPLRDYDNYNEEARKIYSRRQNEQLDNSSTLNKTNNSSIVGYNGKWYSPKDKEPMNVTSLDNTVGGYYRDPYSRMSPMLAGRAAGLNSSPCWWVNQQDIWATSL